MIPLGHSRPNLIQNQLKVEIYSALNLLIEAYSPGLCTKRLKLGLE